MYTRESLGRKVVPIMRCSFCNCGRDNPEVDLLVASRLPGVHICQGCLAAALKTLVDHRPQYRARLLRLISSGAGKGGNRKTKGKAR